MNNNDHSTTVWPPQGPSFYCCMLMHGLLFWFSCMDDCGLKFSDIFFFFYRFACNSNLQLILRVYSLRVHNIWKDLRESLHSTAILASAVISHLYASKRTTDWATRILLFTVRMSRNAWNIWKSPVIPGKEGCLSLVSICFTYKNSSTVCSEIIWIS